MDLEIIQNKCQPFYLAGIDEVGRGPLAGPVVCACATLEMDQYRPEVNEVLILWEQLGITDSKKLTAKKRLKILSELGIELETLRPNYNYLLHDGKNFKVTFHISEISHTLVDEMNILRASLYGMEEAFLNLKIKGEGKILIDGNKVPSRLESYDSEAVVKGDSKSLMIALTSIIAKEYRDHLMKKLGEQYPGYGLELHAGYPTKTHKDALIELGVSPIHRKTFKGVKELIQ